MCIVFKTSVSILFAGKTSKCVYSQLYGEDGIKLAQLTTNQRAEAALRGAATGINTGPGHPPDPHQLNNPEDEDRDGLQNIGIYKNRTTLPS
jgi:hypothetical protein